VKNPITERALTLRLRRALQTQGKHLRITTRQEQKSVGLRSLYVVGAEGVIDADVNIEELAKELGVTQSRETLIFKLKPS
jgi:hypothetical protein